MTDEKVLNLPINRTTVKLLEKFTEALGTITRQEDLTVEEAIAFIIEDYTKSYYADLFNKSGMKY